MKVFKCTRNFTELHSIKQGIENAAKTLKITNIQPLDDEHPLADSQFDYNGNTYVVLNGVENYEVIVIKCSPQVDGLPHGKDSIGKVAICDISKLADTIRLLK